MPIKTKISILLALVWLPPMLLLAQNPLTFTTNNGVITITGYVGSNLNVTNVVIPDTINGYPVTRIGTNAFKGCTLLTNVVIPDGATIIEGGAFSSCSGLKSLTIPFGVPDIAANTFIGCSGLRSMVIPNSVTNIGNFAFYGCSSLTNITFLGDAPSLGINGVFTGVFGMVYYWFGTAGWGAAFYGGLPAVALYNSNPLSYVTYNGMISITGVVGARSGVTNVVIPANINGYPVTNIYNGSFSSCPNLTNVVIPNTVTKIGDAAFSHCSGLKNMVIPNSVTNIGDGAFSSCSSLTNLVIGNNVSAIGQSAFFSCTSLINILIPNSVTSVGSYTFGSCTSLTNIMVDVVNAVYGSANGVLYNKILTTLVAFPGGLQGGYVIPASVTSVGSSAFSYCSGLTDVVIPNSVTNIQNSAFSRCSGLAKITFQGDAPVLGVEVFQSVPGTVYYYYGTSGWGTTYGGVPTVMLGAPAPQIGGSGSVGIQSGNFEFTISGASGQGIVVEASTNLVNWQPVWTSRLTGATTNFIDSEWINFPTRFYRAR